MLKFSIRDVLWLTLVVAISLGWLLSYRNLRNANHSLVIENLNLRSTHKSHMIRADLAESLAKKDRANLLAQVAENVRMKNKLNELGHELSTSPPQESTGSP